MTDVPPSSFEARAAELAEGATPTPADAALESALEQVTADLRAAEPLTMPADVLASLLGALPTSVSEGPVLPAVPRLVTDEAPPPVVEQPSAAATPAHRHSILPGSNVVQLRPARRVRLIASVAAAVVVLGGGGLALSLSSGGGGTRNSASSAVPAAATALPEIMQSGMSYGDLNSLTAALNGGTAASGAATSGAVQEPAPQAATAEAPAQPSATVAPVVLADLAGCLHIISQEDQPMVVSLVGIEFQGQPALVITLPGGTKSYDVFVVRPTCSATSEEIIDYIEVPHG